MPCWTLPQTLLVTGLCSLAVAGLGVYVLQLHPWLVMLDCVIVGIAVGAYAALEGRD